MIDKIISAILARLSQLGFSIASGLFLAIESATLYIIPCYIIMVLDIISALFLSRRVKKKYPDSAADGKFASKFKNGVLLTSVLVFLALLLGYYIDTIIFNDGDLAKKWVLGAFFMYETWSILENWSSENNNKFAKALQRIMVNKAERHLSVPLIDIFLNDENKDNNSIDNDPSIDRDSGNDSVSSKKNKRAKSRNRTPK